MPNYEMPLAWSDNSLAHNLDQMVTKYRFQSSPGHSVCEFPDFRYQAASHDELADLLVADGFEDGTVQIALLQNGLIERHESLRGMAARYRTHDQRKWLNMPPDRLAMLFTRSGRGLHPAAQQWWNDSLSEASRPWRIRHYGFGKSMSSGRKKVEEFVELCNDSDLMLFKLKWT